MKIITPARARVALLVLVAGAAYCGGGLTVSMLAEPEVVTLSEAVPEVCVQAIQSGTEAIAAERRVEQYADKAAVLAGEITLSVAAGDASKMEKALKPIAEHNASEEDWRSTRESAREMFRMAGDDCIAKHVAAEAAAER